MPQTTDHPEILARYIAGRSGASDAKVLEFARLSGGAIQSNYALTLDCTGGDRPGRLQVVVRSDSPSKVAASMTRAQEFAVLQVAYEAGVTVPEPLWLCEDTFVLGVPFCVMTKVPGTAAGRALVRGGVDPAQAAPLVRQLGTELARLHKVVPPEARLAFLPLPQQPAAIARIAAYRQALDALPDAHPVLEYALNWLEDNAPAPVRPVLCHGDFRTGNYMVCEGRLTGVLDWEFAAWSDPEEDLGWLCARSWRFGGFDREVGGIGHKPDLFDAYEAAGGHAVEPRRILYWEVMGMTRWAIIALQQAQRHLSGEERSLELALTGHLLPEIEYDVLTQIDEIGSLP